MYLAADFEPISNVHVHCMLMSVAGDSCMPLYHDYVVCKFAGIISLTVNIALHLGTSVKLGSKIVWRRSGKASCERDFCQYVPLFDSLKILVY